MTTPPASTPELVLAVKPALSQESPPVSAPEPRNPEKATPTILDAAPHKPKPLTASANPDRGRVRSPLLLPLVLGCLALALGMVGIPLGWVPSLWVIGLGFGIVGALLGGVGVGQIVSHRSGGLGLAVAGTLVSLQAVILSAALGVTGRRIIPPRIEAPQPPTTAEILDNLKSTNPKERAKAATDVAKQGSDVTMAVPDLTELLTDEDVTVRAAAARALGILGPWAKGAIPALTIASRYDQSEEVQQAASTALELIGRPTGGDVPMLIASLKSPNRKVRATAAQLLGMLGSYGYVEARAAIGPLRVAMEDREVGVQLFAATALWSIDQLPEVIPVLRNGLSDPDPDLRKTAALGLGTIGPQAKGAVPELIRTLKDDDEMVALYAALALWSVNKQADLTLPLLINALHNKDRSVRVTAVDVLSRIGPPSKGAVRDLIELLRTGDPDMRARAADALGKIGPDAAPAVPALCELVRGDDSGLFIQAAHALRGIGRGAGEAVPALKSALRHKDPQRRALAARTLGDIGPAAKEKEVLDELRRMALKDEEVVRPFAARSLWVLAADADLAVPVLCEALLDKDPKMRAFAAKSLGEIGRPARAAYPLIFEARADLNEHVAQAIADALELIGKPENKEDAKLMKTALTSTFPRYRLSAAIALGTLGADAQPALVELIAALNSDYLALRIAAAETLGNLGPEAKDAVNALKEALVTQDLKLRLAAARTLGSIGSPAKDAVPSLIAALNSEDATVRAVAAEALGQMGEAAVEAVEPLLRALKNREEVDLRRAAACALGGIGPKAVKAREALIDKVQNEDENPSVRVFAAYALCKTTNGTDWLLAKPVLLSLLKNKDSDIRVTTVHVLGALGSVAKDKDVIKPLEELSKNTEEPDEVRQAALTALKQLAE